MTATAPAAPPSASTLSPIAEQLVLTRLLAPSKRPPSRKGVINSLSKVLGAPVSNAQFETCVARLREAALIAEEGLRLTQVGREQALQFLGVSSLPGRCTWRTIQAKYLMPLALGLDPRSSETQKRIGREEALAALLLKRQFNLPPGAGTSRNAVLEAVVCQELGFPDETSLDSVVDAVLRKRLGTEGHLSGEKLRKLAPRLLLGAKRSGIDGLRDVVFRQWAIGEVHSSVDSSAKVSQTQSLSDLPGEFDLAAFAHTVRAASRRCLTGRFGDNKVFISHVWRELIGEAAFREMDLETFKRWLVEANRANLLVLSRADLVSVMNPEDVHASEARSVNAIFHFILLDEVHP